MYQITAGPYCGDRTKIDTIQFDSVELPLQHLQTTSEITPN